MDYGFVDCHCHISAREFEEDVEDVILRTRQAGVKTLIAVTEGVGEFSRVLQLQQRFPDLVSPCLGVHPLQGGDEPQERQRSARLQDLDAALPLIYKHRERLTAVGEIGLDFTPWCAPTQQHRDDQMAVFVKQLDVAKELDLPVRDKLIAQIPLDNICLETDSPALGPDDAHVRNEPCNIVLCCAYVAKIKGLSPQRVQFVTAQNASRLFFPGAVF
ncbi:putative deoxyribonuclease tatdn3-A [Solea solea]|uniref:putative deoxyribonuclease tatdn3-A n=1 Tax=Solea solea TaxID=90069 RepID=UPI00272DC326|nr:putative deoxyribonuclease tatdn3-A [Solea solea]